MSAIKRYTAWFLVFLLMFSLAGCGASSGDTEKQESNVTVESIESIENTGATDNESTVPDDTHDSKQAQETNDADELRTTSSEAEMIAEETGGDLFEILPQEDYYPYTYDALTDVAKKEQNENARPAYQGTVPDLSAYSTVFIGAPVWWGDWPMICYTFFEDNADALSGKTLIPFSTHEGSGLSGFDRKLESAIPGTTVLDGVAIRGNDAQNNQDNVRETIKDWLSDLGY